jgi:hypothetical protein
MSFENYGALTVEIADWLNREDLAARIPSFVRLLEARVSRELRTHDMVKRATATVDDDYFVVPGDWRETVGLFRTNDPEPLEFVSIAKALELRRTFRAGGQAPRFYTHMDGKFFLIPAPSGSTEIELIYRGSVPALSGNDSTNWLLLKSPDLYLYGALSAAEPYLKNDERLPMWKALSDEILMKMQLESDRASFPQGKLQAKFKTFG